MFLDIKIKNSKLYSIINSASDKGKLSMVALQWIAYNEKLEIYRMTKKCDSKQVAFKIKLRFFKAHTGASLLK
jgi:hypothetical protein